VAVLWVKGMTERLLVERSWFLRPESRMRAGVFHPALRSNLAGKDVERQRRIELYTARAAVGLPLFGPDHTPDSAPLNCVQRGPGVA